MDKPIVFLDYDGVVNTVLEKEYNGIIKKSYSYPFYGFVNNMNAINYLNQLYYLCQYDIVVSSTWRLHDNYKECLYNGGLDNDINIIGKTPFDRTKYKSRYEEILAYMSINNFNGIYVIIDDEYVCDNNNFIFCDGNIGFNEDNMIKAYKLLRK